MKRSAIAHRILNFRKESVVHLVSAALIKEPSFSPKDLLAIQDAILRKQKEQQQEFSDTDDEILPAGADSSDDGADSDDADTSTSATTSSDSSDGPKKRKAAALAQLQPLNPCVAIAKLVFEIGELDPEFPLKLALYVRDDLGIRSTANFLVALTAYIPQSQPFLAPYLAKVVVLPSDWLQIATIARDLPMRQCVGLPNCLRTALSKTFSKFNEHSLAKYNKENAQKQQKKRAQQGNANANASGNDNNDDDDEAMRRRLPYTLKQMIRTLHVARPNYYVMCLLSKRYPASSDDFKRCGLEDEGHQFDATRAGKRMRLAVPMTWETQLASRGNTAAVWDDLIAQRQLPFMAMLRNLRNIIIAGVSRKGHDTILERLTNDDQVAGSRQFPYRFFSAYEAIQIDLDTVYLSPEEKRAQGIAPASPPGRGGGAPGQQRKKEKQIVKPKDPPTPELLSEYKKAIDRAVQIATRLNIRPIHGRTIVLCSVKQPMANKITAAGAAKSISSVRSYGEVALLLGLMFVYACESCDLVLFSEKATLLVDVSAVRSGNNILSELEKIKLQAESLRDDALATQSLHPNSADYFPFECLDRIVDYRQQTDCVIVLDACHSAYTAGNVSPCRGDLSDYLTKIRSNINPDLLFVAVNVAGQTAVSDAAATSHSFEHPNDVCMTGFSDSILRFVAERGAGGPLRYIEHIDEVKGVDLSGVKLAPQELPLLPPMPSPSKKKKKKSEQSEDDEGSSTSSSADRSGGHDDDDGAETQSTTSNSSDDDGFGTKKKTKKGGNLPKQEQQPSGDYSISPKEQLPLLQRQSLSTYRDLRFFISSTFLDMHSERNTLLRDVFPQLRRLCVDNNIKANIVEVDLRWGITREDAAYNDLSLSICLNEVARCHPFFIGMLGDRYGYQIPGAGGGGGYKIAADDDVGGSCFNHLSELPPRLSVTELEMRQAVAMRRGGEYLFDKETVGKEIRAASSALQPQQHIPPALIFMRESQSVTSTIPPQYAAQFSSEDANAAAGNKALRSALMRIHHHRRDVVHVHKYRAAYDPLAAAAHDTTAAGTGGVGVGGGSGGSSMFSRGSSAFGGNDAAGGKAGAANAETLLSMEEFRAKALRQLWKLVQQACPPTDADESGDEDEDDDESCSEVDTDDDAATGNVDASTTLSAEVLQSNAAQANFERANANVFAGRHAFIRKVLRFVAQGASGLYVKEPKARDDDDEEDEDADEDERDEDRAPENNQLLVVVSEEGAGKSAAMAAAAAALRRQAQGGNLMVVSHYFDVGDGLAGTALYRIAATIADHLCLEEFTIQNNVDENISVLPQLYAAASRHTRLVIFLDGLDSATQPEQLTSVLATLVPNAIPVNIRFVVSVRNMSPFVSAFRARKPAPPMLPLTLLDTTERAQLVRNHLKRFAKKLQESVSRGNQMLPLIKKADSGKPNYLVQCLTFLCLFSNYDTLTHDIRGLPSTIQQLQSEMMKRFEGLYGHATTRSILCALVLTAPLGGMLEVDLYSLCPGSVASARRLLLNLAECVKWKDGTVLLVSGTLSSAVRKKFLQRSYDLQQFHESLLLVHMAAVTLSHSKSREVLREHQRLQQQQEGRAGQRAQGPFVNAEGAHQSGGGAPVVRFEQLQGRGLVCVLHHALSSKRYEIVEHIVQSLLCLETIVREGVLPVMISAVTSLAVANKLLYKKLSKNIDFVIAHRHILMKHPTLTLQCAANSDPDGVVASNAKAIIKFRTEKSNEFSNRNNAGKNRHAISGATPSASSFVAEPEWIEWKNRGIHGEKECTETQLVTTRVVLCVAFDDKQEFMAIGGKDWLCRVIRCKEGTIARKIKHPNDVTSVVFAGRYLMTGCEDGRMRAWSLFDGAMVQEFKSHTRRINQIVVHPKKTSLLTASDDTTAKLWPVQGGGGGGGRLVFPFRTVKNHNAPVSCCDIHSSGVVHATGSWDGRVYMWQQQEGERKPGVYFKPTHHRSAIRSVAFIPAMVITVAVGFYDGFVDLFDFTSEQNTATFNQHLRTPITTLTFSEDAKIMLTCDAKGCAKLWRSGVVGDVIGTITGHAMPTTCAAFEPHSNRRFITGSADTSVRHWNASSDNDDDRVGAIHAAEITAVMIAASGTFLVTASRDGRAKYIDIAERGNASECRVKFTMTHDEFAPVTAVAITPNESLIITGCVSGDVYVWRSVPGLAGNDGSLVAKVSTGGAGSQRQHHKPLPAPVSSIVVPQGSLGNLNVLVLSLTGRVLVVNLDQHAIMKTYNITGPTLEVTGAVFTSDSDNDAIVASNDGDLHVCRKMLSAAVPSSGNVAAQDKIEYLPSSEAVRCIAASLDGTLLCSGTQDGCLSVLINPEHQYLFEHLLVSSRGDKGRRGSASDDDDDDDELDSDTGSFEPSEEEEGDAQRALAFSRWLYDDLSPDVSKTTAINSISFMSTRVVVVGCADKTIRCYTILLPGEKDLLSKTSPVSEEEKSKSSSQRRSRGALTLAYIYHATAPVVCVSAHQQNSGTKSGTTDEHNDNGNSNSSIIAAGDALGNLYTLQIHGGRALDTATAGIAASALEQELRFNVQDSTGTESMQPLQGRCDSASLDVGAATSTAKRSTPAGSAAGGKGDGSSRGGVLRSGSSIHLSGSASRGAKSRTEASASEYDSAYNSDEDDEADGDQNDRDRDATAMINGVPASLVGGSLEPSYYSCLVEPMPSGLSGDEKREYLSHKRMVLKEAMKNSKRNPVARYALRFHATQTMQSFKAYSNFLIQ